MKKLLVVALLLGAGCVTHPYPARDNAISSMYGHGTKNDISLMVGAQPLQCEAENAPWAGFLCNIETKEVTYVEPSSALAKAGVVPGDSFPDCAPFSGPLPEEGIRSVTFVRKGRPKTFTIPVSLATMEQCYWEVHDGEIDSGAIHGYVKPYYGSWNGGYSHRNTFYRATCRFINGHLMGCTTRWQS